MGQRLFSAQTENRPPFPSLSQCFPIGEMKLFLPAIPLSICHPPDDSPPPSRPQSFPAGATIATTFFSSLHLFSGMHFSLPEFMPRRLLPPDVSIRFPFVNGAGETPAPSPLTMESRSKHRLRDQTLFTKVHLNLLVFPSRWLMPTAFVPIFEANSILRRSFPQAGSLCPPLCPFFVPRGSALPLQECETTSLLSNNECSCRVPPLPLPLSPQSYRISSDQEFPSVIKIGRHSEWAVSLKYNCHFPPPFLCWPSLLRMTPACRCNLLPFLCLG